MTIIRRAQDCFWLITGSALGVRDRDWIESHLKIFLKSAEMTHALTQAKTVELRDITSAYGVINVAGPLSRQLLQKVSDQDLSHESFAFMTAKDIQIGYAPALAYRVTYIGELGWELYIPSEYLQYAYELLQTAGAEFGLSNMGYRAIDSLRIEKRYLAWGVDITPDYNPFEAGLDFLIDWNKGDFIGASALAKIKATGVQQKLVCLALDQPLPVFGGEAIFFEGKAVAQTTSGNFGYSVGKSLVLGYLPVALLEKNGFEVEAFGERSPASILKTCAYDPGRSRILA